MSPYNTVSLTGPNVSEIHQALASAALKTVPIEPRKPRSFSPGGPDPAEAKLLLCQSVFLIASWALVLPSIHSYQNKKEAKPRERELSKDPSVLYDKCPILSSWTLESSWAQWLFPMTSVEKWESWAEQEEDKTDFMYQLQREQWFGS